ncbi:MAG: glycosyltransferase family 2 protein [Rickettsiales bacterium]|nr:glycosyltransferase family 2 protein [Rickettsiales bacterium]
MSEKKILVYVVAYNASKHIKSVLELVPCAALDDYEILVSDDFSSDDTSQIVAKFISQNPDKKIKLITQQKNLGYGGNQKFGYQYAIDNGFYAAVLLHGDGQYSPKLIPQMITPIVEGSADAMLGSRMINKKSALKGGMPLYKFVGNIILTKVQNFILRMNLSEYHTGLRAYKTEALSQIPFQHNNNGFSFDTDILIQLIDRKCSIGEIHIPTHYGDEICRVNGMKYAFEIVLATLLSRAQRLGIYSCEKFKIIR